MEPKDRIIVALDVDDLFKASILIDELAPHVGCFKIGLELLHSVGSPKAVKFVHELGGRVFFDGKFMDIPNTVKGACTAAAELGVAMMNVHCLGGSAMMKAAIAGIDKVFARDDPKRPKLLGVTILTSLGWENLVEIGLFDGIESILEEKRQRLIISDAVRRLTLLAINNKLDGVICSPQEIELVRSYCGPGFLVITPGVRPVWAAANDQKRVMTPAEAIRAGADYLVIGRPITKPLAEIGSPVDAVMRITEEIASVR